MMKVSSNGNDHDGHNVSLNYIMKRYGWPKLVKSPMSFSYNHTCFFPVLLWASVTSTF